MNEEHENIPSYITDKGLKDIVSMTKRLYSSGHMKAGEAAIMMIVGCMAEFMSTNKIPITEQTISNSICAEISEIDGLSDELQDLTERLVEEDGLTDTTIDDILNGGV